MNRSPEGDICKPAVSQVTGTEKTSAVENLNLHGRFLLLFISTESSGAEHGCLSTGGKIMQLSLPCNFRFFSSFEKDSAWLRRVAGCSCSAIMTRVSSETAFPENQDSSEMTFPAVFRKRKKTYSSDLRRFRQTKTKHTMQPTSSLVASSIAREHGGLNRWSQNKI